jgi:hypothetical protein
MAGQFGMTLYEMMWKAQAAQAQQAQVKEQQNYERAVQERSFMLRNQQQVQQAKALEWDKERAENRFRDKLMADMSTSTRELLAKQEATKLLEKGRMERANMADENADLQRTGQQKHWAADEALKAETNSINDQFRKGLLSAKEAERQIQNARLNFERRKFSGEEDWRAAQIDRWDKDREVNRLRAGSLEAEHRLESRVERYADDMEPLRSMKHELDYLDTVIPRRADDKTFSDEVPGIGPVEGLVPDIFTSDDGSRIRAAGQKLVNDIMRTQSGQAVSKTEEFRNLRALLLRPNVRESQYLIGLNRLRELAHFVAKQEQAKFPPEVPERYKSRGGIVAEDFDPSSSEGAPVGGSLEDELDMEMGF